MYVNFFHNSKKQLPWPGLTSGIHLAITFQFDCFSQGHNYLGCFQVFPSDFKVIGDLQTAIMAEIVLRYWGALGRESLRKVIPLFLS